jgi:hypothetical protein
MTALEEIRAKYPLLDKEITALTNATERTAFWHWRHGRVDGYISAMNDAGQISTKAWIEASNQLVELFR